MSSLGIKDKGFGCNEDVEENQPKSSSSGNKKPMWSTCKRIETSDQASAKKQSEKDKVSLIKPKKKKAIGCFADAEVEEEDQSFVVVKMKSSPGTSHSFKKPHQDVPSSGNRESLLSIWKKMQYEKNENQAQTGTSNQTSAKQCSEKVKVSLDKPKISSCATTDWFSKFETPITSPHDSHEDQTFLKVQNADKLRKICRLCLRSPGAVVVCCSLRSDVESVWAHLTTKGVSAAKLHGALHMLKQKDAEQNFKQRRVKVLVITVHLLLRMDISHDFSLVNFDLPINFSEYQRLAFMSKSVKTFINEKSPGTSLMQLVESGIEVPEFVREIYKEITEVCHFARKK